MSLPSGHSATLLLRVGDTGFDFSRFSWPLLHDPPEQGNYSRLHSNTWHSAQPNFFDLWRQKEKRLAFLSFYCSRYNIYMHLFFFFVAHWKVPFLSSFSNLCCCCRRFSHMSFSIFLLSVYYLDYCSLFPAPPVLFILFLVSPGTLQNWI